MRGETILLVDDEKLVRWSIKEVLTKEGFLVVEADSLKVAQELVKTEDPGVIVLDQHLPDGTGTDLLEDIKTAGATIPVIMLTAVDRSSVAVQAMKLGAVDYITKPVNFEELVIVIEKALETTHIKRQLWHLLKSQQQGGFQGIIGASKAMEHVFEIVTKIAASGTTTVLVTGESGTGKELVARAIHGLSPRRASAFIAVNCSALTESLMESELFGHEKGSFTDAHAQKKGMFELADGGTIFLDEIGDLSPSAQVKLLRVLENRTFRRVGGTLDITVDVRVIAATNQVLEQLVHENKFRSDLFFRLNVARVHMPPVREREHDVLLLAEHFLQQYNAKFRKEFKGLSKETMKLFMQYHWPGNVREIRNVVERAALLDEGEYIFSHGAQLGHLHELSGISGAHQHHRPEEADDLSLHKMEKKALLKALQKAGNNQTKAAQLLKISRDTLRYRMKKYGLSTNKGG